MNTIPILMYHNIGTPPAGARLRGLYVRRDAFARQMWLLRMLGFQGLSMSAAMPYLRGEKQGRVAVITLDDGYLDAMENALPALQANGFSATCYFVSQRMGQNNDWDAAALNVSKPLMSESQVRAWHAAGMEVGAHVEAERAVVNLRCAGPDQFQQRQFQPALANTGLQSGHCLVYVRGDFQNIQPWLHSALLSLQDTWPNV